MFGSTEISRKYICYAKFSEEFKSGRKIWGNFARKEVILQFVYSLLILVNTLADVYPGGISFYCFPHSV